MTVCQSANEKWVLITGGSRGIGKELVVTLASRGYDIAFTFNRSVQAAKDLELEVLRSSGLCTGYQCDGSDYSQIEKLCDAMLEKHGAPYAVVNNMGITGDELIYQLNVDRYRQVMNSNLDSAIFFNKCLVPAMSAEKRGRIIHMSSVAALKGNKGQLSYAASKAALIGITKTLAIELARFKITVNAIAPGYISSDMTDNIADPARKKIIESIPLKRMGRAREVAALTDFLLSENGDYITGQTLVIDGGLTC